MSAMGQKLMLEQASEMSGLPTKTDMRLAHPEMSAKCQKRTR